jgi:tRNA(fMet)-specific endonuclease VapC
MFVLDTDILSLVFYQHPKVLARLSQVPLTDTNSTQPLVITSVTRAEVLRGRIQSILAASTPEQLVQAELRFQQALDDLTRYRVVYFDLSAAPIFTRLRAGKRLKSRSHADLLNACVALAHNATFVTRNTKDYEGIPNLKLENWAD